MARAPQTCLENMVRYQDDDDDESGRALLIGAGVVSGLLAGAVVAHRYGGWRGIRRALARKRSPLLAILRASIPSKTLSILLDRIGIDEIIAALLSETRKPRRSRGGHRPRRIHSERRLDPDLDEYEVEDFERAAAGLDDDDDPIESAEEYDDEVDDEVDEYEDDDEEEVEDDEEEIVADSDFDADLDADPSELEDEDEDEELDDDEEEEPVDTMTPEALEEAVLAAFRRHPVLRQRALQISVDEDGVAELTGWVRRERDVRLARRVAAAVPGVERVIVDVAVRDVAVREVARVVSDVRVNGA